MLYLLLACAKPPALLRAGPALGPRPAHVAVAPAALLAELPGAPQDAFHAGEFAGEIWFSGGFERFPEHDNQVRSVSVELSHQDRYADQARAWLDSALRGALTDAGVDWQVLSDAPAAALRRPRRVEPRGTGPHDGRDNQHLPRFELQPEPLDPGLLPELPEGCDALLVPLVVQYYSHNGGWFVGQDQGNPAGARVRVLWSLHDVHSGAVLTWGEIGARYLEEYAYSPNAAQRQDYLLAAEAQVAEALRQQMPW